MALGSSLRINTWKKQLTRWKQSRREALNEFDSEWFPTMWRSCMTYGSSLENRYGGFLSPCNGACMTNGPLTDDELGKSPSEIGRKRARESSKIHKRNLKSFVE